MNYGIIGLCVGFIMGLTGAGGALIAIPLFLAFAHASFKEATALSLIVVLLGSVINLLGQRTKTDYKMGLILFVFGLIGNIASLPIKSFFSDIWIAILLCMIALFSFWNIWVQKKDSNIQLGRFSILILISSGFILGILTTLTGLGGGVLLVPLLIGVFHKSYEEALPISLLTIAFISLTSLILQWGVVSKLVTTYEILSLALGIVLAVIVLKFTLKFISVRKADFIRKIAFSLVIVYSIASILVKVIQDYVWT